MRRPYLAVGIGLLAAASVIPFLQSQQQRQTPPATGEFANETTAAVRLEFGAADKDPRSWNGSVAASAGRILGVRNWRPRPGDEISGNNWKLSTRKGVNFGLRAWEVERLTSPQPYLLHPGVVVDVSGRGIALEVRTDNGNFDLRPFDLAPGVRTPLLNGAVIAERLPAAEKISGSGSHNDFPSLAALPNGRLVAAWVTFANKRNGVLAREFDGTKWSEAKPLAPQHEDIFLVKLARDRRDRVWAIWSAQVDGNWDLYAASLNGGAWSQPERLTTDPQPDLYHVATTDSNGNLWLAWQGFRNGKSDIFARRYTGSEWTPEEKVSASPANDWSPAIAADAKGTVHIGWDSYDKGNYDILLRRFEGGRWSEISPLANTPKLEAHVSLACDRQNRLWAAWHEAGMDWGKDTGFLPLKQGTPLYKARWLAVAIHDRQRWMEPVQNLEAALPERVRGFNDLPVLAADPSGRIWLTFRHRLLRIQDTPSATPAHRAAWELFTTTFEGERWREPMTLPFSNGRQDMRIGFAATSNALYGAWPMDNRDYEEFLATQADVYAGRIPLPPPSGAEAKFQPRVQPDLKLFPTHYTEADDLNRIHGYQLTHAGKTYKIYRGDTHRHTEFSMDGNNDGTLLDAYRYAIDAAELDFMLVSEHNSSGGPDNDYPNWLLQQMCDLLMLKQKFVPFYGYERSVNYPNGHRNVLFTKRGNPTLPIPAAETKGLEGARSLYAYLKKYNGIAISHTSASNMGTDWRDNDPDVEPLVEIYQGDRVSAEYEGGPKAAHAGNPASAPGGFRPAGYVWNAWAKGYKLGVQSASDHLSTHISYACTIATDFTRDGLIDAMKARHSYGATDNIVLDYRMKANGKEYLQGDITDVKGDFTMNIKVLGTAPIRQIDIVRNNQFLLTRAPLQKELDFEFRDGKPLPGESYYYVRVLQVDDQIAWSSPIWIKR